MIPVYGVEGGGDGAEGGEDGDLQRGKFVWDPGSKDPNFFHALSHAVLSFDVFKMGLQIPFIKLVFLWLF